MDVKQRVDLLRGCDEAFVRTSKKAAVDRFGIHIDHLTDGLPESVVIGYSGCSLEVVNVDDHNRASGLVAEDALPFLGQARPPS